MSDDQERIASLNSSIKKFLLSYMPSPCIYKTFISGFNLVRREDNNNMENCFEKPLAGLVIQGIKHSFMLGVEYTYGENQSIVAAVDMPISSYITTPSPANPFLFLYLYLDKELLSSLSVEMNGQCHMSGFSESSVSIADADCDLMEMFLRLLMLNEKPEQIAMRAPMMLREIHYLLLIGPHGKMLRQLHSPGTHNNQVVKAINWIRENYKSRMRVESLARQVGMSVASLHRHFKKLTGLSPLQYQKHLRLYEARRLMLVEHERASSAGFAVGYESIAQFNREYKKIFGEPPLRDTNRGNFAKK